LSIDGESSGSQKVHRQRYLAKAPGETAPGEALQTVARPRFLEKLTDVGRPYLNPPQQAMMICVDEKELDSGVGPTQPGLPLNRGRCGTMTHDDKRHGNLTAHLEQPWPHFVFCCSSDDP
jgi:hypothetical protein